MKFTYTVWFMDLSLSSDEPEHEWPACFVIDGAAAKSAKSWGDRLAEKYASSQGQRIVQSTVESVGDSTLPGLNTLPAVVEGEEPADDKIGW